MEHLWVLWGSPATPVGVGKGLESTHRGYAVESFVRKSRAC